MQRAVRMRMLSAAVLLLSVTPVIGVRLATASVSQPQPAQPVRSPEVTQAAHHDVSPALRDIAAAPPARRHSVVPLRRVGPVHRGAAPDPVRQGSAPIRSAATLGAGFAGVGDGDYGFTVSLGVPDTNLAVGATQVVQWVNTSFAVFDKATHAVVKGPIAGNSLWAGFGGDCEANNDGDPSVQYDQAAGRWVFTQFSVSTKPYLECVAVSQTSDATGAYNRYSFDYGNSDLPDYPKLSVWPDGYYVTYVIFTDGQTFAGPRTCAWDRTAMINGADAQQVCFQLGTGVGVMLSADLDGAADPPSGAPNYQLALGSNALDFFTFRVDFATPAKSKLTGPTRLPVAGFSDACGGRACVPQKGTTQKVASLGGRLMYRLAYRHLNGTETLLANHAVTAGGSVGVRWYEIRTPAAGPTVFQSGTFAPDANYRWMASTAMDKVGNIGLGYSVSSSSTLQSIAVTGRVPADPPGTLEAEVSVKAGGGAQLPKIDRWGDYSSLQIDPSDDCTFWFTTEYLKASGTFNWSTWINSFTMPGC